LGLGLAYWIREGIWGVLRDKGHLDFAKTRHIVYNSIHIPTLLFLYMLLWSELSLLVAL
jgi:hypothetical protein